MIIEQLPARRIVESFKLFENINLYQGRNKRNTIITRRNKEKNIGTAKYLNYTNVEIPHR